MKFFIGRNHTFWVVQPKTGKVRKLPLSSIGLVALFLISVSCTTVFAAFTLDRYTGGLVSFKDVFKQAAVQDKQRDLEAKTRILESTVESLQRQNEEAKRLNARVENKLDDLEGILGAVGDNGQKSNKDKRARALFKPASLHHPEQEGPRGVGAVQQRRNLQKLDHVIRQLRGLPLLNPVPGGIITSGFGYRQSPTGEGVRFHHGIDISLRDTAVVRAAGAGVVRSISTNSGYGLTIDIQHSRNVVTRYAHLSYSKVKIGQRVTAGTPIAFGGSSGRSTGRHLHYEVRIRGRSQNPMTFMGLSRKIQMVLRPDHAKQG